MMYNLYKVASSLLCNIWDELYYGGPKPKEQPVQDVPQFTVLLRQGRDALNSGDPKKAIFLFLRSLEFNLDERVRRAEDAYRSRIDAYESYVLLGQAALQHYIDGRLIDTSMYETAWRYFDRVADCVWYPKFQVEANLGLAKLSWLVSEDEEAMDYLETAVVTMRSMNINDADLEKRVAALEAELTQP
ncbi:MAG TPA: hypothetical protein VI612_04770 [Candidatus Nanoarchaeia archaeon]|nr:hypothetical protein [Candidatus Nanoarchaeia archaeon]